MYENDDDNDSIFKTAKDKIDPSDEEDSDNESPDVLRM